MERIHFYVDRCVMCGAIVEEGRWVCACCEEKWATMDPKAVPQPSQKEKSKKCRWFGRKKDKQ